MSFDMTGVAEQNGNLTVPDDSALSSMPAVETPSSTVSPGMEGSAFGSGSSVLSTFEPPAEGDFAGVTHQPAVLTHFMEDPSGTEASLEELEAVISKLQAIYLYRQGLKALQEERIGGANDVAGPPLASLSADLQAALLGAAAGAAACHHGHPPHPSHAQRRHHPHGHHHHHQASAGPFRPEMSAAVPGSPNSIWRMNATDTPQLQHQGGGPGGQYPSAVVAAAGGGGVPAGSGDFGSLAQLQFQLQQDIVRTRSGGRQGRVPRRRTHRRQASSPAALRPPQWADPSWHPMTAVLAKGEQAGAGTGVFIPSQAAMPENKTPGGESSCGLSGGLKMATADDLPEEWLY